MIPWVLVRVVAHRSTFSCCCTFDGVPCGSQNACQNTAIQWHNRMDGLRYCSFDVRTDISLLGACGRQCTPLCHLPPKYARWVHTLPWHRCAVRVTTDRNDATYAWQSAHGLRESIFTLPSHGFKLAAMSYLVGLVSTWTFAGSAAFLFPATMTLSGD